LPTSEVSFVDCFVPDSHRLSEEGDGEGHLRKLLAEIRIITGAMAIGTAKAALAEAVRYAENDSNLGNRSIAFKQYKYVSRKWQPI